MLVNASKQTRHWRDRSPYPGPSSSSLPRRSDANKYEPAERSTSVQSRSSTPTTPRDSENGFLVVLPSQKDPRRPEHIDFGLQSPRYKKRGIVDLSLYSVDEIVQISAAPVPLNTTAPEQQQSVETSATNFDTWNPESSLEHQKAKRAHALLEGGEIPRKHQCAAPRSWARGADGTWRPHLTLSNLQTCFGAKTPYSETDMVREPEDLDSNPPPYSGPAILAETGTGNNIEETQCRSGYVSSSSSYSSSAESDRPGHDVAEESEYESDWDVDVDDYIQQGPENEEDLEDEIGEYSEIEDVGEKMAWFRQDPSCKCDKYSIKRKVRPQGRSGCLDAKRSPISKDLESLDKREQNSAINVFLGILVILLLLLCASIYLMYSAL